MPGSSPPPASPPPASPPPASPAPPAQPALAAQPMPVAYDPAAVEPAWYARWEAAGLFTADPASRKPKYAICLPPPNVTGVLHMGHATNGTVQDILARYRRMRGDAVLFLPGTDHAAIATQNVIERQLAAEGLTKEQLGRPAFAARVERWYVEMGETIVGQFRELGASLDWSRRRFTMDAGYRRAVATAFVRFYERGWLYRGPRIVNWCPRCSSAISDEEVVWTAREDTLYFLRYPLESPGGGEATEEGITVATVRPETILADTGVAVHPEDARYRAAVGRRAVLPLVGRRLPVVADGAVVPEFGSGALKVTPGHDAVDFEIGARHGLPLVAGLSPDGRLNAPDLPRYHGLTVARGRAVIVEDLAAGGYLVRAEPHTHQVGHCDRCGRVIEPLVSEQWFLRTRELARLALAAGAAGRPRWHPARYERQYLDWLRGLKDWCVSRQLWLGHPIPVSTCPNGHRTAAVEAPRRCPTCGATPLTGDPDVLDTWFSAALWPFATLGWPDETADLRAFYPTALNGTDRQIINLWVSRMIMCGLALTGDLPFQDVTIHATILSRDGRRMEKSKPTTMVDPRAMIARYGADAVRAWCAQVAMSTQDVRFDERRIEGHRRFANKLWNAARLVLAAYPVAPPAPAPEAPLALEDRWILSRLERATALVTHHLELFDFHLAIAAAQAFAWHELCDWYLEAAKPRLRRGEATAGAVALRALDVSLRLLHPFMPFVTEALWHLLPAPPGAGPQAPAPPAREFLVRCPWPEPDGRFADAAAEARFDAVRRAVEAARRARQAGGAPQRGGRLVLEDGLELALGPAEVALVRQLARLDAAVAPGDAAPTHAERRAKGSRRPS